MINKKLMLIAIILVSFLAVSAVSAADNVTDEVSVVDEAVDAADSLAVDESQNEDILAMDDSQNDEKLEMDDGTDYYWGDDHTEYFDYDTYDYSRADIKFTKTPKKYGERTVKVKLTDNYGNPISGVNLGIMTSYNNKATKVTTNANGIATYQIPAKATSFKLLAGFWYSGTRVSEYIEHEGTTLLTYTTQKSITLSNVPATIKVSQTSYYYKNANLKVVVKNSVTKKAVANKKVKLKFSNGKTVGVTTNSKGVAKYTMKYDPKKYIVSASLTGTAYKAKAAKKTVKILKAPITITPVKLLTSFNSGKEFKVKVIDTKTKKPVSGAKLMLRIFSGRTYKTVNLATKCDGFASVDASALAIGNHKVLIFSKDPKHYVGSAKISLIKITKATLKISAPEVTNAYKVEDKFKVKVKNKETGKAMKGVTVIIKVFTGKSYKIYTDRTDEKGLVKIDTQYFAKGTHKVVILARGSAYTFAATKDSKIKISNKIPTSLDYEPGLVFHATAYWYNQYQFHTHTYSVTITPILKDKSGNVLHKTITLKHSDGATATCTSGESVTLDGGRPGTVTLIFAGDSKYMKSKYVVDLGNEPN